MRLRISRALLDEIRTAAAASPDLEVCGLLLGRIDRAEAQVEAVRACVNVAAHPADSFEIDPAALIAAHRVARAGGPRPIGHYHSHPRGTAGPSARDAAAAEPGSLWIIVAGGDLRCWHALPAARFAPVVIVTDNR